MDNTAHKFQAQINTYSNISAPQNIAQLPNATNIFLPNLQILYKYSQQSLLQKNIKKLSKYLNQKQKQKLNYRIQSLSDQNSKLLQQHRNIIKNTTSLAKKPIRQNFTHINPRVYQPAQPKYIQQHNRNTNFVELPKIPSSIIIPQLQQSKVLNDYRIISHVGKGCFSIVSAAVNKNNNKKFAIKTYNRIDQLDQIRIKNIQNQVQNLYSLHHQNIIQLKHAIKDGRKIQLIMQNGGKQSISGLLRKYNIFDQNMAKKYFRQIAQALAYCHSQNICHRDIKLQNILVDDSDKIKIIDFGFSLKCNNKMRLTSYCGTPPYMSPQLAARLPYNGQSSDVWALGVVLYLMLTGKFPFKAGNQKQLYRIIQQGKYKSQNFSVQAKQLLDQMLKVDQKNRINAKQIVKSRWLITV